MEIFYCGAPLWSGQTWLARTGAHHGGMQIMAQKTDILPIYMSNVYCGAVNILKQDFLSIGGEVVAYCGAPDCSEQYGDIILLGTKRQYAKLLSKMAQQPWKLKEIAIDLSCVVQNVVNTQRIESQFTVEEWDGPIIDTGQEIMEVMKQYPLLKKQEGQVALRLDQCRDYEEYGTYLLALQSKGYRVITLVGNNEQFKSAQYFKSDYIAQVK